MSLPITAPARYVWRAADIEQVGPAGYQLSQTEELLISQYLLGRRRSQASD
jgi:hypothetical protein